MAARPRLAIYLQPGQLHAASTPTAVTTILGSCVSVCLFDPVSRIGGMNHFLLPDTVEAARSYRFGNVAIEALLLRLCELGARRGRLRARIFGGASLLGGHGPNKLGDRNVLLAVEHLAALTIPVGESDVGGDRGRKIVFHTDDGVTLVRSL